MKHFIILASLTLFTGCQSLRFAPSEAQKQSAWLHQRTASVAADIAKQQDCPQELVQLTEMSAEQSNAILAYYGLPQQLPAAQSIDDILSNTSRSITAQAAEDAVERPDLWDISEAAMELGIAIAGILGGAYGLRIAGFLRDAQNKSRALKEIILGNELFKQQHAGLSNAFKQAHVHQSPATRQIVAEMKK